MNRESKDRDPRDRDERALAELIKLAGPRAPIPKDLEERVHQRVRSEWQTATKTPDAKRTYRRVRREWSRSTGAGRPLRWALAAASVAVVMVALVVSRAPQPLPPPVAAGIVVKVLDGPGSQGLPGIGHKVFSGDRLTTGRGEGLSLLLPAGESLRLDEASTLLVHAGDRFGLESGRLYIDSGDRIFRDRRVTVETTFGPVTDIGTQFAVAAGGSNLEIAVREGRVSLSNNDVPLIAVAGERVRVDSEGQAETGSLDAHDEYWAFASELAPAFDVTNRSLLDFLRWVARETGRELVFENDEVRMAAMRAELHGTIEGIEPLEAVAAIMPTTRFEYRIEATRIVVMGQQ